MPPMRRSVIHHATAASTTSAPMIASRQASSMGAGDDTRAPPAGARRRPPEVRLVGLTLALDAPRHVLLFVAWSLDSRSGRPGRQGTRRTRDRGTPPPPDMRTCVRMSSPYVELHCHSAYSFLDGASMPDELVPAALGLGHDALALTDHNSVSGSMELAQAAQGLGLRAIHGAELDLDDGRHVTLLVESARGWSNLCRLITRAHAHTREGRPSAPPSDPQVPLDAILEHAEGL